MVGSTSPTTSCSAWPMSSRSLRRRADRNDSKQWLAAALFADTLSNWASRRSANSIPEASAGPTVRKGFEADSRVNPWDFVLMIEGALLFAGSVARRLGANTRIGAVFPFCVESVAVGYGSATASEETIRWLPGRIVAAAVVRAGDARGS